MNEKYDEFIEDFDLSEKLNIKIKDKICTEQEFEFLNMDLIAYYIDEEELKQAKKISDGVS